MEMKLKYLDILKVTIFGWITGIRLFEKGRSLPEKEQIDSRIVEWEHRSQIHDSHNYPTSDQFRCF